MARLTAPRRSRTQARTRWTVTLTCPRPRNRAVDDFHLRPDRVTSTVRRLIGPHAELTITDTTVRLVRASTLPPDLMRWQEELAMVLSCLHLDTRSDAGLYALPRPVRTEVCEEDVPAGRAL